MTNLYVGGLVREILLTRQQITANLYIAGLFREVLHNKNTLPTWITASGALPIASSGAEYNINLQGSSTTGSKSFGLVYGNLPPGLVITPTGNIYGIPGQVNQNTTYNFTLSLSDGINIVNQANSIQVEPNAAVAWQTPAGSLTAVIGGESYSNTLTATSSSPVMYQLESGALPAGLTLNSNSGVISGVPTRSGLNKIFTFTIVASA